MEGGGGGEERESRMGRFYRVDKIYKRFISKKEKRKSRRKSENEKRRKRTEDIWAKELSLHFDCSVRLWLIHLKFYSSTSTEVIVITEGDRFVCSKIMFPWNAQQSWSSCILLAELSHACYFTNVHGQVSLQIHNSYSDTCSLKIRCCNIAWLRINPLKFKWRALIDPTEKFWSGGLTLW